MIFVDTSAWVALYVKADKHHEQAQIFWRRMRQAGIMTISSFDVFGETLTVIRARAGLNAALRFGKAFLASQAVIREAATDQLREEAWRIFQKYDDKNFSFVDCLSFALMTQRGIKASFAFDDDFRQMGYAVNALTDS